MKDKVLLYEHGEAMSDVARRQGAILYECGECDASALREILEDLL